MKEEGDGRCGSIGDMVRYWRWFFRDGELFVKVRVAATWNVDWERVIVRKMES